MVCVRGGSILSSFDEGNHQEAAQVLGLNPITLIRQVKALELAKAG